MAVSVVVPVYNGETYVRAAIECLLAQDFQKPFEILVNVGRSTDRSKEIVRLLAERDRRIRLFASAAHSTNSASVNFLVHQSQYDLIAFLDQDDLSLPNRLSTQYQFLERHPDIGVLGTDFENIDENAAVFERTFLPTDHHSICEHLRSESALLPSTVMLRKSVWSGLGGLDVSYETAGDWDLWLRASRVCKLANLPVALTRYRFHPKQTSRQFAAAERDFTESIRRHARLDGREISFDALFRKRLLDRYCRTIDLSIKSGQLIEGIETFKQVLEIATTENERSRLRARYQRALGMRALKQKNFIEASYRFAKTFAEDRRIGAISLANFLRRLARRPGKPI